MRKKPKWYGFFLSVVVYRQHTIWRGNVSSTTFEHFIYPLSVFVLKQNAHVYKCIHMCSLVHAHTGRKEMFYLTTHSTHFIYSDMVKYHSDREETCCHHMGYSFRLTARVLLYSPSHRLDGTYHNLCYTSRGEMGPPNEGSIR